MNNEMSQSERSRLRSWIRATTLGWLLGFVLVVALAMIWDMIGGGAQLMVGLGMGAGVGYTQGRVSRAWAGRTRPWFWASTVGMGLPFLLWDLSSAAGVQAPFSLPACVLLGGLLTGVLEQRLLRPAFERTSGWIPACGVGWGVPAGIIAMNDSGLFPTALSILSPIAMLLGGSILGAVTGQALDWMSPRAQPIP